MKVKRYPSVFDYTDYRIFMADYANEQKKKLGRAFSYRKFADKAGYNSSGLYLDIVNRRTDVQTTVLVKLIKGFGFGVREAGYFENMIFFNQALTTDERDIYYKRMLNLLSGPAKQLQRGQFQYFSRWYYPAIRELLSVVDFRGDYTDLARQLKPSISPEVAKTAINFLKKHGFIKKDEQGRYRASEQSIASGAMAKTLQVAIFQRTMLDMAKASLDRFPPEERKNSTQTFSASPETFEAIKTELDACRARIRNLVQEGRNETRIYHLNMHMFPLSIERDPLK